MSEDPDFFLLDMISRIRKGKISIGKDGRNLAKIDFDKPTPSLDIDDLEGFLEMAPEFRISYLERARRYSRHLAENQVSFEVEVKGNHVMTLGKSENILKNMESVADFLLKDIRKKFRK